MVNEILPKENKKENKKLYLIYLEKIFQDNVWSYEETTEKWDYMTEKEQKSFVLEEEGFLSFEDWLKKEGLENE